MGLTSPPGKSRHVHFFHWTYQCGSKTNHLTVHTRARIVHRRILQRLFECPLGYRCICSTHRQYVSVTEGDRKGLEHVQHSLTSHRPLPPQIEGKDEEHRSPRSGKCYLLHNVTPYCTQHNSQVIEDHTLSDQIVSHLPYSPFLHH